MKRIIALLLVLVSFGMSFSMPTFATTEEVTVVLDGDIVEFDVPAQIINGRTMVPVRKIFELLGMVVDWNGDTQAVTAYKEGIMIELTIDDTTVYRNSIEQTIDVPAQIINSRTLVPIRIVSEYAGANVDWDGNTNTVYINSTNKIQHINWSDNYEYWGEIENSRANGYGILYHKSDKTIAQMGIYSDSKIITGSDLYDNGEYFIGNFKDGNWENGTFYYDSGDYYTGDFLNSKRHGTGTYFYKDGSFHKGKWENNLPNGYGIFYDAVEDVQYQGNYINGEKNGEFLIDDFYENKSYHISYGNENNINQNNTPTSNESKYKEEYDILIEWANEKTQDIYAEGKNIYDEVYSEKLTEAYAMYGIDENSDPNSFAYSNAIRQVNAMKPNIIAAAEIAQKAYEAEELETLAYFLETKIAELKNKYNIK